MAKKINIGFIANNLSIGGVSSVLINLCNELDPETYNVHLIVLSDSTTMEDVVPLKSHIHKITFNYQFSSDYSLLGYLKNSFNYNQTEQRAKEVLIKLNQLNLDVLHFHTLPRQLVIGILAKKRNKNLKLVFTDHTYRLDKSEYNWYQFYLLKKAYQRLYKHYNLIAVSPTVGHYIINCKLNHPKKQFKTLTNTIAIKNYKRTTPINEIAIPTVVYVSRVCKQKGFEALIEAWKSLHHKAELLIVGPDESDGHYHALANGIPNITFTGKTSNVKAYLNRANIAIFPSEKEGLPLSLLEMMAFELPIIVSDIPELQAIITDKLKGLHFKKNDAQDLAQKISWLIDNPAHQIQLGKAARKKVEEICELNNSVRFHDSFYQDI